MKKITLALITISLTAAAACAGAQSHKARAAGKFAPYSMDGNYFSCLIPADWSLNRDRDSDEQYKIYEIQLIAPRSAKTPISIKVSFYAKDNQDFNDYKDFINSNSKNALDETRNAREKYAPVRKIKLNGREGFMLGSERLVYLHPETKSDESALVKERIYVLPAREGFYVLRYSAPKADYNAFYRAFLKVTESFKGLP